MARSIFQRPALRNAAAARVSHIIRKRRKIFRFRARGNLPPERECPLAPAFQNAPRGVNLNNPTKMDIFVSNLPFQITEREISEAFAAHGEVSGVKMLFDKVSGRFRGMAFVSMARPADAEAAIAALNGADLGGRPMRVDRSRPREERFNGFGGGFDRGGRSGFRRGGDSAARENFREGGGSPSGFKPRKDFRRGFGNHSGKPFRSGGEGFKKRSGGGYGPRPKKFWDERDGDGVF